jgi:hypothetical protein
LWRANRRAFREALAIRWVLEMAENPIIQELLDRNESQSVHAKAPNGAKVDYNGLPQTRPTSPFGERRKVGRGPYGGLTARSCGRAWPTAAATAPERTGSSQALPTPACHYGGQSYSRRHGPRPSLRLRGAPGRSDKNNCIRLRGFSPRQPSNEWRTMGWRRLRGW